MKKYIPIIICTIAALLWVGFIWSNSAKTGEESGKASSQVHEIVNEVAQSVGIDKPISERTVRKGAHFTEYMILGLIVCADVLFASKLFSKLLLKHRAMFSVLTLPLCAAVALVDEFIVQGNTQGRGPSFIDVFIDMSGVTMGTVILLSAFLIVCLIAYKRRALRAENS